LTRETVIFVVSEAKIVPCSMVDYRFLLINVLQAEHMGVYQKQRGQKRPIQLAISSHTSFVSSLVKL